MIFLVADCMAHAFALNTCSFYINTLFCSVIKGRLEAAFDAKLKYLRKYLFFFISFSLYFWLLYLLGDILTLRVFSPLFKVFLLHIDCFYHYLTIYTETSNLAMLVVFWKWWKAARKLIVSLILLVVLKNCFSVACRSLCWQVLCLYLQKLRACCKGSESAFQAVSALGFQSGGPWSVLWLLVSVFAFTLLH